MNCFLDRFLTPRIEEYTSYLVASNYNKKDVMKIRKDCKRMDRVELIQRPGKQKYRNVQNFVVF